MTDRATIAGKTVLIVGGSKNIGFSIGQRAAADGASVILAGRDGESAQAAAALVHNAAGIALDITVEDQIAAAAAKLDEVDHIVITAAAHHNVPVSDLQHDLIVNAFEAKVIGPLLLAKHFGPRLNAGGSIVLFSGVAAWRPAAGYTVMGILNGAVSFAASHLAKELAPIRVNAVSPGIVDSGVYDGLSATDKRTFLADAAAGTLVSRTGQNDDVVDAVLWLLTASFVSGETIHVEGGARHA